MMKSMNNVSSLWFLFVRVAVALLQVGIVSSFQTPMIMTRNSQNNVYLSMSEQMEEERYPSNRRSFMISSTTNAAVLLGILSSGLMTQSTTVVPVANAAADTTTTTTSSVNYKNVAMDIASIITNDPNKGPTLVRLAWHSSGTYDKTINNGGSSGGTIRFQEELSHGGNAGLSSTAVSWLEPIHTKYSNSGLSYADLYTLAGVVAIKTMGGPTIPWSSGRIDLPVSAVTPDGRLPNADSGPKGSDTSDSTHLRTIFNRMGFNDQEIVALSGAHALGRCHSTASGYDGPWTPTPTTFNNAYFTLLSNLKWIPKEWSGPYQYVDAPTGKLMMLPTDLVLLEDKKFAKWVNVYSKDSAKFYSDFTAAFQKLEEIGTSGLTQTEWA